MAKIPFIEDPAETREPLGYRLIDGAWVAYYESDEDELEFYRRMEPKAVLHRRPPAKAKRGPCQWQAERPRST